jgi:peptide deformylase
MHLVDRDHPILHRRCRDVFKLNMDTIRQMYALLNSTGGLGLAAPQVGIDGRFFITAWGEIFVNPKIVREHGPCISAPEGCLSLPGVTRFKSRAQRIVLNCGRSYDGQEARVIQHELDHLNGVLLADE